MTVATIIFTGKSKHNSVKDCVASVPTLKLVISNIASRIIEEVSTNMCGSTSPKDNLLKKIKSPKPPAKDKLSLTLRNICTQFIISSLKNEPLPLTCQSSTVRKVAIKLGTVNIVNITTKIRLIIINPTFNSKLPKTMSVRITEKLIKNHAKLIVKSDQAQLPAAKIF